MQTMLLRCSFMFSLLCSGHIVNAALTTSNNSINDLRALGYHGCVEDPGGTPLMYFNQGSPGSISSCQNACKAAGYRFAGLKDGGHCCCDMALRPYCVLDDSQCSSNCWNDWSWMCGAWNAQSVFDRLVATAATIAATFMSRIISRPPTTMVSISSGTMLTMATAAITAATTGMLPMATAATAVGSGTGGCVPNSACSQSDYTNGRYTVVYGSGCSQFCQCAYALATSTYFWQMKTCGPGTLFDMSLFVPLCNHASLVTCNDVIDVCACNPCQNGGVCIDGSTSYTCSCSSGYSGTNCETNINECASNPCQNGGVCTDGVNSYTCACRSGYSGTNCQTDINECSSNPCQNGGVCTNGVNSYTCSCSAGYTGTNCQTDINECSSNPCQNGGVCTNGVNSYTCSCSAGYTGTNCKTVLTSVTTAAPTVSPGIDECASNPCQNGGTCIDGSNSYTCSCGSGYSGKNCQTNINECASSPCQNGGVCTDGVNSYTCACSSGYSGTNCQTDINECSSNPCQNGAVCTNGVNSYTCSCSAGYSGTNCQTDINECSSNPCQNGGVCTNGVNFYKCSCSAGYTGTNCKTDIDECASTPCQNGGVCTDGVNSYRCTCSGNYTGTNCQTPGGNVVNGNWGSWNNQSCSVTCGTGTRARVRFCDSPAPSSGGSFCQGSGMVVESCEEATCSSNNSGNSLGVGAAYVNKCPNGYFTCRSGRITCIIKEFQCDCTKDCDDNSDEDYNWGGCLSQYCGNTATGITKMSWMFCLVLFALTSTLE